MTLPRCWLGAVLVVGLLGLPAYAQLPLKWKLKEGDHFYLEITSNCRQIVKVPGRDLKQDTEYTLLAAVAVQKKNMDNSVVLEEKIEALTAKNTGATGATTEDRLSQV